MYVLCLIMNMSFPSRYKKTDLLLRDQLIDLSSIGYALSPRHYAHHYLFFYNLLSFPLLLAPKRAIRYIEHLIRQCYFVTCKIMLP